MNYIFQIDLNWRLFYTCSLGIISVCKLSYLINKFLFYNIRLNFFSIDWIPKIGFTFKTKFMKVRFSMPSCIFLLPMKSFSGKNLAKSELRPCGGLSLIQVWCRCPAEPMPFYAWFIIHVDQALHLELITRYKIYCHILLKTFSAAYQ